MLFFHYWQNVFADGWNGFAGRFWPAGHSLETPDLEDMAKASPNYQFPAFLKPAICFLHIVVAGEQEDHAPSKFLEFLSFCALRDGVCPKQDTVARLKSKKFGPHKILGWLRHCILHLVT